jgi:hypothetical protein
MTMSRDEFLARLSADRRSLFVRRGEVAVDASREALLAQCREALRVADARVSRLVDELEPVEFTALDDERPALAFSGRVPSSSEEFPVVEPGRSRTAAQARSLTADEVLALSGSEEVVALWRAQLRDDSGAVAAQGVRDGRASRVLGDAAMRVSEDAPEGEAVALVSDDYSAVDADCSVEADLEALGWVTDFSTGEMFPCSEVSSCLAAAEERAWLFAVGRPVSDAVRASRLREARAASYEGDPLWDLAAAFVREGDAAVRRAAREARAAAAKPARGRPVTRRRGPGRPKVRG